MRMSHVTHANESCHTCEWVMSHMRMSHVTHLDESTEKTIVCACVRTTARVQEMLDLFTFVPHTRATHICVHLKNIWKTSEKYLKNRALLEQKTWLFKEQRNMTISGAYPSLPLCSTPFRVYVRCLFYVWCVYVCMHAHADTLIVATPQHTLFGCTHAVCIIYCVLV